MNDKLRYSVGGFFRGDNGIRNPEYRANQGGQIRASATYLFDEGQIHGYVKYLDDSNVFYLPIPVRDPRDPTQSLSGLLNPNTGTLASSDLRRVRLRTLDGTPSGGIVDADLAEGMHPQVLTTGLSLEAELGAGWLLSNHARYIQGNVTFNGLFSLTDPRIATDFLAAQLTRAQAGFGDDVTSVAFRTTNDGQSFDPATTAGLVMTNGWWAQEMGIRNFVDDLRVTKQIEIPGLGTNDITAGVYISDYQLTTSWMFNTVLTELRNNPRRLDVVALNAVNEVVGTVTENGFLSYGDFVVNSAVDAFSIAGYLADTWRPTSSLTIDVGFRYQSTNFNGTTANVTTQDLGDPTTLADDAVGGPDGTTTVTDQTFSGWALSVGADYGIIKPVHVFGRFTRAYRIPDLENIYQPAQQDTERVLQGEIGLKLSFPRVSAFLVGFVSDFDSLAFSNAIVTETGDIVNVTFDGQTRTIGGELEVVVKPFKGLNLAGAATLQNPKLRDITRVDTEMSFPEFDGNRVPRLPNLLLAFRPSYGVSVLPGAHVQVYGNLKWSGNRFVDFANNTELPDFGTIDAGLILTLQGRYSFQVHGSNLTNSAGLTEGNPRSGALMGQGSSEAIFGRPILGRAFQFAATYRYF